MPIYEYICNSCCEKFSLLQRMSEAGKGAGCPKCGSTETRKIISGFSCSGSDGRMSPSGHSHGSGGG